MGIAVPGGTAAALATDANVVDATGERRFLMNAAEIETATRLGLGYTIVVINDDDYVLLFGNRIARAGEHVVSELTKPDFERFAESLGIDGYRPWRADTGSSSEVSGGP